jgi:hypothetical protein
MTQKQARPAQPEGLPMKPQWRLYATAAGAALVAKQSKPGKRGRKPLPAPPTTPADSFNLRDPKEWRFDSGDVPDSELVACCWWEYARESTTLREWAALTGKNSKPISRKEKKRRWEFVLRLLGHSSLFHSSVFEPFPTIDDPLSFPSPWQSLSPAERKKRSYPVLLEHVRTPIETAGLSDTVSLGERAKAAHDKWCRTELPKFRRGLPMKNPSDVNLVYHGMEVRAFNLLWGHFDNAKIVAAFAKWVHANRPPTIPEPSDGSGHKPVDWRKKLRDLGVLRLRNYCTVGQLPYRCPEAAEYFSGWTDSQFSAACKRALKNFRQLLGFLPEGELPIHAPSKGGRAKL